METVTVKATANHMGAGGFKAVGDTYETDKNHAAELKRNGLVEFDGEAAPEKPREKVLVSDKPREKAENTKLNVPTAKAPTKGTTKRK